MWKTRHSSEYRGVPGSAGVIGQWAPGTQLEVNRKSPQLLPKPLLPPGLWALSSLATNPNTPSAAGSQLLVRSFASPRWGTGYDRGFTWTESSFPPASPPPFNYLSFYSYNWSNPVVLKDHSWWVLGNQGLIQGWCQDSTPPPYCLWPLVSLALRGHE